MPRRACPASARSWRRRALAAEFDETAAGAAAALDAVRVACDEVRRSRQLKAVLAAALAAGNVLNEGTPRGEAAGFTLDSLHKLADVKSARLSARREARRATRGGRGGGRGDARRRNRRRRFRRRSRRGRHVT